MNARTIVRGGIALLVGVLVVSALSAWMFLRDQEVERRGACGSATYQLAAEPEDGAEELTFELTSAAPGEVWDVVVERDDLMVFSGLRTTDTDGEIDLDLMTDSGGDGDVVVTATPESGPPCTVELGRD